MKSVEAVLTSTVLRGRPGYRDVLRLYAVLLGRTHIIPPAAAMRIVGLRDIAALYEWWSFFQVVSAVSDVVGPPTRVDPASQTWQGAELGQGLTAHLPGEVQVEFNRSFSRTSGAKHRSYSVPLRPDILLENPCERHVFDAKFAFDPIATSLDDDSEDESLAGRARRWHIHKMHTYRDALDRVRSVRVLYPGSIRDWYPVGPPNDRDGVGSLPLRIDNAADSGTLRSLVRTLIPSQNSAPAEELEPG